MTPAVVAVISVTMVLTAPGDKERVNTSNLVAVPCHCYWSPGVEGEGVDQGSLLPLALGAEEAGEADGEHQGLDLRQVKMSVVMITNHEHRLVNMKDGFY